MEKETGVPSSYRLLVFPDRYVIVPLQLNESIVIDRVTRDISLSNDLSIISSTPMGSKLIYGIWGVIRLISGPHLIVITRVKKVGTLFDHDIFQITESEVVPYTKTVLHLTEQQLEDDRIYKSMLDHILKTENFYFSTSYDLTHTLQRLSDASSDFNTLSLYDRSDERFVWNHHLIKEFSQQAELNRYCLPIMMGAVHISSCSVNDNIFTYAIISRRNVNRAGVRFYMRGVDQQGNAANNVETEQIFAIWQEKFSFVQTRGSVPLLWSQKPNLRYKPNPAIQEDESAQLNAMRTHLDSQTYMYRYGKQILVSLLDNKGIEKLLAKNYAQKAANMDPNSVRFEAFDFHLECKNMRWDRLQILIDRLMPQVVDFGWYRSTLNAETGLDVVQKRQQGVVRTNCIDCLDRTNVVQSMLSWEILERQFQDLGILKQGQKLSQAKSHGSSSGVSFEHTFKNAWADNADLCAKQYTATGALKTDYTRTGKRTKFGLVMDGYNSAMRYIYNNFWDGFRQDSFDLFLGNYIVEEDEGSGKPSRLKEERDWKYKYLPLVFLFAIAMCVLCLFYPADDLFEWLMYLLFWLTASIITLLVIFSYGLDFVDKPKLKKEQ